MHHFPWVTRQRSLVNDQGACCALSCGFLELVCPPAVIGHRFTAEFRLIFKLRVIDKDNDDLALHIDFEIVPLILGRSHAISTEDQIGICGDRLLFTLGPPHKLVAIL